MKPVIGILAVVDEKRFSGVKNAYIRALEEAGCLPLLLPFVELDNTIEAFVSLCDGFLFTGGADIDPKRYGEEPRPECGKTEPNRDELEFRVLAKVMKSDKPIMAICRGAQLINVFLGGSLYQDISGEFETQMLHKQTEEEFSPSHEVKVIKETPLYSLLKKERIIANSFHHQAIKDLGRGLAVMAEAEDGMIEAVYLLGERYLRAYQWHPERLSLIDGDNKSLFEDFISACSK